jgi:hypothetical protein
MADDEAHEELDELLTEHSLVTFRYYAQHAGVPVSRAKEVLQTYADARTRTVDRVHVVYLVGGIPKSEGANGCAGRPPPHGRRVEGALDESCHPPPLHRCAPLRRSSMQYKLVPQERLNDEKETFSPLTACHAYSVHSAKPQSGEALYVLNQTQDRNLYDKVSAWPRRVHAARVRGAAVCHPHAVLPPPRRLSSEAMWRAPVGS